MAEIRRSALIGSFVNYVGFIVAMINIYFFININHFTPEQYGLTRLFIDLANPIFAFSSFGYLNVLYKYSPIYQRVYKKESNSELLKHLIIITNLGFALLLILSLIFQQNITNRFAEKAPLFNNYFYWLIPFSLGTVFINIAENYFYTIKKAILASIIKELLPRIIVCILVILFVLKFYNVDIFLKLYSLSTIITFLIILIYYFRNNTIPKSPFISQLTKKLKSKIITFSLFSYVALFVISISTIIDSFFIATISKGGLRDMGIFTFATFIISIMQVPQRFLNNIASVKIYESLQLKQINEVQRIYKRASLNLFIFGLLILFCSLLGFDNLFQIFNFNPIYKEAKIAIIILGISKLFDMITSINTFIMLGSKYWKFDLYSNVLLIILALPLNYYLIKNYGIYGAAITNLIVMILINTLRCLFIWKKLKVQPLSINLLWVFIISIILFLLIFFIGRNLIGLKALIFKCGLFFIVYIFAIYIFKLTPDLISIITNIKKRFKIKF